MMSTFLSTAQALNYKFPPKIALHVARASANGPAYCCQISTERNIVGGAIVSLSIAVGLASPLPTFASPSTPFSESQELQLGLENGRIRQCPSNNPNCISTTSRSASFAMPWRIPEDASDDVVKKIENAILTTQKNPRIVVVQDTPNGQYLQAEVDGGLGRDVLEFLVKKDVVTYRSMAKKVIYVYPFTTALGSPKSQEERMMKIVNELGGSLSMVMWNCYPLSLAVGTQQLEFQVLAVQFLLPHAFKCGVTENINRLFYSFEGGGGGGHSVEQDEWKYFCGICFVPSLQMIIKWHF